MDVVILVFSSSSVTQFRPQKILLTIRVGQLVSSCAPTKLASACGNASILCALLSYIVCVCMFGVSVCVCVYECVCGICVPYSDMLT